MSTRGFLWLLLLTLITVPWAPMALLAVWAVVTLVLAIRWAPRSLRVFGKPWFLGSMAVLVVGMAVLLPGVSVVQRFLWIARFLLRAWILILWLQLLRYRVSPQALVRHLRSTPLAPLAPLLTLSVFLLPRLMEDLAESWALFSVWVPSRWRRLRALPLFLTSVVQQAVRVAEDLSLALTLEQQNRQP